MSQIRTPYNLILILLATAEFLLTTVGITSDVFSLVGWGLDRIGCMVTGTVVTTAGIPTYAPINLLLLNFFNNILNPIKMNINNLILSFRLCINDHTVCTVHMPTIQLSSFPSDWRKDIIIYHSSENFISNPVVFIIPCLASTLWMGKVHSRSVRVRVSFFSFDLKVDVDENLYDNYDL